MNTFLYGLAQLLVLVCVGALALMICWKIVSGSEKFKGEKRDE